MAKKWKIGVCEVEKYTTGNTKKKKVFFCPICSAWMCIKCSKNSSLRAEAMVNRAMANFNKEMKKDVTLFELFNI